MTARSVAFPLVLAAPSGAGKTTLARALVERDANVVFALSATTRPPRRGEVDGHDYRFVDEVGFDHLRERGDLLEWAHVHQYRYGTLRASVDAAIRSGRIVVLDIDVQGARRIRQMYPDAVLVFVLPPSAAELERRLRARGSEDGDAARVRLRTALTELESVHEFDYVVVNEDLDVAIGVLESIVTAERARAARQKDLAAEAAQLTDRIQTMISKEIEP